MNNPECPCRKKSCARHGNCDACRKFHKTSKYPPACERGGLFGHKKKSNA